MTAISCYGDTHSLSSECHFSVSPPIIGIWDLGGGLHYQITKKPNRWRRWWFWLFLGWRFKDMPLITK